MSKTVHVSPGERTLTTGERSDNCVATVTWLQRLSFSPVYDQPGPFGQREEIIPGCRIIMAAEREVCLVCVRWLGNHGVLIKSRRHVTYRLSVYKLTTVQGTCRRLYTLQYYKLYVNDRNRYLVDVANVNEVSKPQSSIAPTCLVIG